MKTTIKLGLCAAAFLLMFAGCSNAVKPTTVAKDSFRGNADAHNNDSGEILKISSTSLPTKYGDADNKYLIEVTFSKPVTDSVKNAITFNALTPSGAIDKAPTIGSTVPVDITADGTVARCVVTGKDISVWMKVTGSAVEAVNGRHLNLDGDTIEGEVDDDDYYKPFALGTPTGILGNTNYLNNGSANGVYAGFALTPLFKTAATDLDSSTHQAKDPSLGTLINRVEITFDSEAHGVKADDISGIIKDHLRIEQYVNGEWKEVPATFTYAAADKKWTAPLTLNSNTQVRYKWIGLRSMPKLKHTDTKYQYDMKYSMACDIADIVVPDFGNETDTNRKATEFAFWNATSVMEAKKATDGTTGIDLKLKLAANPFSQSPIFISKTLASVSVTPKKDTGDNYFVDFAGFDESVLKKENFKIVYTGGKYSYSYSKPGLNDKGGVHLGLTVDFNWKMQLTENQIKGSELAITGVEVYGADSTAISTYPKAVRSKVSLRYTDIVYTKAQAKKFLQDDLKDLESKCVTDFYKAVYDKVPVDEKKNKSLKEALAWQFVNAALTEFTNEVNASSFNVDEVAADTAPATVDFYISPEVKIAKFTGVYQDGANKKDITVPALGFGARTPQDDQYANAGWVKVTIVP